MKTSVIVAGGLCLLLAGMSAFHTRTLASSNEVEFKAIDEYVTARLRSARIPGLALVIVKGDQVVYSKAYGRADPAGRPMTPQTPFMLGSITKPFTALAVMQLVEAGKVELDAPVQRYIPWFRVADPQVSALAPALAPERPGSRPGLRDLDSAGASITVRQLLYQTSGLPQPPTTQSIFENDDQALERSVRSLANVKPIGRPGQSFVYSNGNYNTLGLLVQYVSGQSYEEYVKHHIFAPLDMQHSYVSQDEAIQHGMASGYRWWFGIPVAATLPFDRSDLPAGYAIAGAEDMAHFLIAQMNGGRYRDRSVLSPAGITLMHSEPPPGAYGLGWEFDQVNGRTLVNHDGGVPNFEAALFFDPEERVGVFLAANVMSALDTFSSPPSSDPIPGPTVRVMAESVLNLATNRPLPAQGPGNALLYLLYDLVLLALTGMLLIWLTRIPARYDRLAQRGIARWSSLVWRSGLTVVLHFALPGIILYAAQNVPSWKVLSMYQPDLVVWLEGVATVLGLKGLLELALIGRVFGRTHQSRIPRLA